jgi:hypothetical protein
VRFTFKQNKTLLTDKGLQNLIRPSSAQLLWFSRKKGFSASGLLK